MKKETKVNVIKGDIYSDKIIENRISSNQNLLLTVLHGILDIKYKVLVKGTQEEKMSHLDGFCEAIKLVVLKICKDINELEELSIGK